MNIEPLETRIAPASVLAFTDVDGDNVKITVTSGGQLILAGNVIVVGGQLQLLDLSTAVFQGAKVSIVATRDPVNGGDGFVNVGRINAAGVDLGTVLVDGDLGVLDAGNPVNPASACKGLTAQSLGRFGTATGASDLVSDFDGRLDKLKVKADVVEAFINITDSSGATNGKIGSVFIGGSLLGGVTDFSGSLYGAHGLGAVTIKGDIIGGGGITSGAVTADLAIKSVTVGGSLRGGPGLTSGVIFSSLGALGPVKIGGDIAGGEIEFNTGRVFGRTSIASVSVGGSLLGSVANSARIHSDGAIGPVTIGGSMVGGAEGSGAIAAGGDLGPVKIGGSVLGGGVGGGSGIISAGGDLAAVTIGGSLRGRGIDSAQIVSGGDMGLVNITGSLLGGGGMNAGRIDSGGALAGVSIGGSLQGGTAQNTGVIASAGDMGFVKIGGNLAGSSGAGAASSGRILAGAKLAGISIGGSIVGSDSSIDNAEIYSAGDMGPVRIGGDVLSRLFAEVAAGAAGNGYIHTGGGAIASVTIGGHLSGGKDANSGKIFTTGALGPVKIGGDLRGGFGAFSGMIDGGRIASVTIGGSMTSDDSAISNNRDFSGVIFSFGAIGAVKIRGDLRGGDDFNAINPGEGSAYIQGGSIKSVFIGGSIIPGRNQGAGALPKNASIRAENDIGSITVAGNLVGSEKTEVILAARGGLSATSKNDVALGKIVIGGRVERAQILAGYDSALTPVNADAQIGSVTVSGDWIASDIVAGVAAGGDALFGTGDDFKLSGAGVKDNADASGAVSKIASVIIKGSALGTLSASDLATFGIEAQQLASLKVAGAMIPLTAGAGNDLHASRRPLGVTRDLGGDFDFHAFEIPA